MNSLRAVIIDVDGTLVDSNDLNARAWLDVLQEFGYELPYDRARHLVGMGSDTYLPTAIDVEKDSPEGRAITKRRSAIFKERYLDSLEPFGQVRPLIERMLKQGLRLIVASSAQADEVDVLLQKAKVDDLLTERVSASDADASKPNPDLIVAALEQLSEPADRVVMLGDTGFDVESAARAGIATVALRSSGWSDADLKGAVEIYDDPADLLAHYDASMFAA